MGFLSSLFGGGSSLSVRCENGKAGEIDGINVLLKGNLYPTYYTNVPSRCKASFCTSISDMDSDEPILSKIEDLKVAPNVPIYQHFVPGGVLEKDMGFYEKWIDIGFIPDESYLISPYKGTRNVEILVQCLTSDHIILSQASTKKMMYFDEVGYLELDEERLTIQKSAIKLAADIAYSDGKLDKKEGNIIKEFAKEKIEFSLDKHKTKVKRALNGAIETGFSQAKNRKTNRLLLTSKIKDVSNIGAKEDLLNLCLDVMAGDGVADENELRILEEIATNIGYNYKEYISQRDKRMISLDTLSASTNVPNDDSSSSSILSMERTMGIKSDWTIEEKQKHLKKEFRKWNARRGSLKDKKKEANVQKMLDMIGKLMNHYKKKSK